MKQFLSLVTLIMAAALTACAPNAAQLQKVVEENPEIIFKAIEKNPAKFMQSVQKAANEARASQEQDMIEEETKKREEEFKNPKKPELADNRVYDGAKEAKVTIVEYSDFQCPYCQKGHATTKELLAAYPGKVRVLFKNLPIERIHPQAMIASQYYEAIGMQSPEKATKFKGEVFENQQELGAKGEAYLKSLAKKVGADMGKVAKDINSEEVKKRIAADQSEAEKFEFSGTPGYLINGVSLRGAYPIDEFKKIIDKHLAQ